MTDKSYWAQWPARALRLMEAVPGSRWAGWTTLLLLVLLGKSLASVTWSLLTPSAVELVASAPAVNMPVSGGTSEESGLRELATLHLFGVAAPTETAPGAAVLAAPDTHLNLTLRGVFATSDADQAIAIIADPGGKEEPYRRGATVPGGAVLYAVYPDRVILQRGGGLETLWLPKDKLSAQELQAAPAPAPNVVSSPPAAERLGELRNEYLKHPEEFWQKVRIMPVTGEGGAIKGYSLDYQDPRVLRDLGIRPTDVIVAVNGMPLSDPSKLYQVAEQLAAGSDVVLDIERDGHPETLRLAGAVPPTQ